MASIAYQRRCAVEKAWARERSEVMQGRGTRPWTKSEQSEIIRTGKCAGYEGNHMLSVKANPQYAGDEKNVQFLTHEEHYKAHNGDWKNDPHGKYDIKTGTIKTFRNGPEEVQREKLNNPLSQQELQELDSLYQQSMQAKQEARRQYSRNYYQQHKLERLPVDKQTTKQESHSAKQSYFERGAANSTQTNSAKQSYFSQSSSSSNDARTSAQSQGQQSSAAGTHSTASGQGTGSGHGTGSGQSAGSGHGAGQGR